MTLFDTNCTLPITPTTFVSSPNVRGTLDIIWSCISVLLICTWSILHLNVPVQRRPLGKNEKLRASFRHFEKIAWMVMNLLAPEWALGKAWSDYRAVSKVNACFKILADEDKVPWSKSHTYLANMGGFAVNFDRTTAPAPRWRRNYVNILKLLPSTDPINYNLAASMTSMPDTLCLLRPSTEPKPKPSLQGSLDNPCERIRKSHTEPNFKHGGPIAKTTSNATGIPSEKSNEDIEIRNVKCLIAGWRKKGFLKMKSRYSIGEVDWHENDFNSASMMEAIESVTLDDFEDSERDLFLTQYLNWLSNLRVLQGNIWVLDANQLLMARQLGLIKRLPTMTADDISDRSKDDLFVKMVAVCQVLWFTIQLVVRLSQQLPTSQLELLTLAFAVCTVLIYAALLEKPKDVQIMTTVPAARYLAPKEMSRLAFKGPMMIVMGRAFPSVPNFSLHENIWVKATTEANRGASVAALIFGGIHFVGWNFIFPTIIEKQLWRISSIITAGTLPLLSIPDEILRIMHIFLPLRTTRFLNGAFYTMRNGVIRVFIIGVWVSFTICFVAARVFVLFEVIRSLAFLPAEAFQLSSWPNIIPHIN